MAIINIHVFTGLLEALDDHIKKLTSLLQQACEANKKAREVHETMCKTSRYELLKDLENHIRGLNSLSQQVLIVANNAYSTNTAIYQTCHNLRRELDQI